jgi:hypothetical protein
VRGLPAEQDGDDGEHRGTGEVQQTWRELPYSSNSAVAMIGARLPATMEDA